MGRGKDWTPQRAVRLRSCLWPLLCGTLPVGACSVGNSARPPHACGVKSLPRWALMKPNPGDLPAEPAGILSEPSPSPHARKTSRGFQGLQGLRETGHGLASPAHLGLHRDPPRSGPRVPRRQARGLLRQPQPPWLCRGDLQLAGWPRSAISGNCTLRPLPGAPAPGINSLGTQLLENRTQDEETRHPNFPLGKITSAPPKKHNKTKNKTTSRESKNVCVSFGCLLAKK